MLKISRVVIISILIVTQLTVWAQNNTNSPYSRFGYGELADRSFAAGRAMGGIGIGLRSGKQVNPMNPASYTAIDSMTFIFDAGAHLQLSWFDDGTNKQRNTNGNLEHLAMMFPLHKQVAMSVGLMPYSFVGYSFGETVEEGDLTYTRNYVGSGGLNEVYAGLSIDIWKKRLALGINVGYLFGKLNHERNVVFPSTSAGSDIVNAERYRVNDIKMDFGLQYTHPLSAKDRVTVGVTYSPANDLNTTAYNVKQIGSGSTGELTSDTLRNQRFDLPNSFGVGASFVRNNKLTIGADVLYEQWSKSYFADQDDHFEDRWRVAAGVEYIPELTNRSYFKQMRYRGGLHYSNSYKRLNMTEGGIEKRYGYKEYGVSLGFGFPIKSGISWDENRSIINLSFEYVKIKPELKTMIDEQYVRFTLNYTFNELWFFKQKL